MGTREASSSRSTSRTTSRRPARRLSKKSEALAERRSSRNREHEPRRPARRTRRLKNSTPTKGIKKREHWDRKPRTGSPSQTIEKQLVGTGGPCSTQKSNRAGTGSTNRSPSRRLKKQSTNHRSRPLPG